LKWGFGWDLGPFEVLDAIGLEYFVERVISEGNTVAPWISDMLSSGFTSMYVLLDGKKEYYSINDKNYIPLNYHEKELYFDIVKSKNNIIKKHWSASLVDLDDGVAAIELHSVLKPELNPIDGSMIEMLKYGLDWVDDNKYKGLIISGSGANFCAGANLNMILQAAEQKNFDSIERLTNGLQQVFQAMRYSNFPVVAAPYGLVLGGGMEMIGGCNIRIAAAESYIGLVEVGVGLIPGAGGNLRLLSHLSKKIKTNMPGSMPIVQKAFETIGFAKVATSAKQAQSLGYMTADDCVVVNRSHLLYEAKSYILANADSFIPPDPETFKLAGSAGRLAIKAAANLNVSGSGGIKESAFARIYDFAS
jgi:3-hydroxyacyl-CoA dehydrogenase